MAMDWIFISCKATYESGPNWILKDWIFMFTLLKYNQVYVTCKQKHGFRPPLD